MSLKYLTVKEFSQFPFHDAYLHEFKIVRDKDCLNILISIGVTDNSYEVGYSYPQHKGITKIVISDCWEIETKFIGGISGGLDTFYDGEIFENSDYTIKVCRSKLVNPKEFLHYRFKLNSGSVIDAVAKAIYLQ